MSVSKKPIVWSLFAAGGTVTAFLAPIVVFCLAIAVPLGWLPHETFGYIQIQSIMSYPLIRLLIFAMLFFSIWHAAHRLRITVHDFGVRADKIAAIILYSIAGIATVILALALI